MYSRISESPRIPNWIGISGIVLLKISNQLVEGSMWIRIATLFPTLARPSKTQLGLHGWRRYFLLDSVFCIL